MNITLDTDRKTVIINGETILDELIGFFADHNLNTAEWKIVSIDEELFGYLGDEVEETRTFSYPVILGKS